MDWNDENTVYKWQLGTLMIMSLQNICSEEVATQSSAEQRCVSLTNLSVATDHCRGKENKDMPSLHLLMK